MICHQLHHPSCRCGLWKIGCDVWIDAWQGWQGWLYGIGLVTMIHGFFGCWCLFKLLSYRWWWPLTLQGPWLVVWYAMTFNFWLLDSLYALYMNDVGCIYRWPKRKLATVGLQLHMHNCRVRLASMAATVLFFCIAFVQVGVAVRGGRILYFWQTYANLLSQVVSPHLWSTPLNLYQQAMKGFLS